MIHNLKLIIGNNGTFLFYKLLLVLVVASFSEFIAIGILFPIIAVMLGASTSNFGIFHNFSIFVLNYLPSYHYGLIILLIFFIFKGIFLTFANVYRSKFIFSIHHELSMRLLKNYTLSNYSAHIESSAATHTRNIIIEVNQFVRAYLIPLTLVISDLFVLFFVCFLLVLINWIAALILLVLGAFLAFLYIYFYKNKIKKIGYDRQFYEKSRINHLNENFSAFKEILIYGRTNFFLDRFSFDNKNYCQSGMQQSILAAIPRVWYEPITVLLIIVLSLVLVFSSLSNDDILIIIGMFTAAGIKLLPGISRVLSNINIIKYSSPVIPLLINELKNDSCVGNSYSISSLPNNSFLGLKFCNVRFSFSGDASPLFSDLSFSVNRGDCIGITGDSGAGKSTILNLLLGFQSPNSGDIVIDGVGKVITPKEFAQLTAYVGQKVPIFDESIAFNIALSDEVDIDLSRLESAISAARLGNLIKSRGSMSSKLGSGGVKLSGGEIQRIGIARALYFGREVLILDEPTSSLDMENEKSLIDDIYNLKGSKTIFMVTHRAYPLSICNKTIQL